MDTRAPYGNVRGLALAPILNVPPERNQRLPSLVRDLEAEGWVWNPHRRSNTISPCDSTHEAVEASVQEPPSHGQQGSVSPTPTPPSEEAPSSHTLGSRGMNLKDRLQLTNVSKAQINEDEGSGQLPSPPDRAANYGREDGAPTPNGAPATQGLHRPSGLQDGGSNVGNRKECPNCQKLVHKKNFADHVKGHLFSSQETLEAPPDLRCQNCEQKRRVCRILVRPWAPEANTARCQLCIQYKESCNFTRDHRPPGGRGSGNSSQRHPVAILVELASRQDGSSANAAGQ